MSTRRCFCGGLATLCFFRARLAAADEIPASLQADLVARLAAYDKNMKARAGDRANIVIVVRDNDSDSERTAAQLVSAFGRLDRVGGLPHTTSVIKYAGAPALVAACRERQAAMVLLTSALAPEVDALRAAFDGQNILTIAPSAEMTRRGIVLGFELVSSRPKLFINLSQAQRQNVAMASDVLKLMTVFR